MKLEFILDAPMPPRAHRAISSWLLRSPGGVRSSPKPSGHCRTIAVYGPGAKSRRGYVAEHLATPGNRVVFFDLAYFDRRGSLRVSVDGLHPTPDQIVASPLRARRTFRVRDEAYASGPVMIVGLGRKTCDALGVAPLSWERQALKKARARWPDASFVFRPKGEAVNLEGCALSHGVPIEQALSGLRAVVCKHSNVAVDAAQSGIPCYPEAGAAVALYRDNPAPPASDRHDFLARLSWWEWSGDESKGFWDNMERILA